MKFSHAKSSYVFVVFVIFVTLLTVACDSSVPLEKREQKAADAKGNILLGVVYSSVSSNFFLEGVRLAVDAINQKGGLLGRQIQTIIFDDKNNSAEAEKIAMKLAAMEGLVAVIGHSCSQTAIPASIIYEKAGIVFISYGAKDPALTLYGGNYTFRNIPTFNVFGHEMARYTHSIGLNKSVVFYEREATHKSFADMYKKEATALGAEIIATRSYFGWERDFKEIINQLKKEYSFDSIVISGSVAAAAELVKQLDQMGVTVPIIGSDDLDSPDLFGIAGKASEGTIVPTVFDPRYPNILTRKFVETFQEEFELIPNTWAAQGYDAISLLAHVITNSGSTVPIVISSSLRFLENWQAVTGTYSFIPTGDIIGKEIYFKKIAHGKFTFISKRKKYDGNLFNYIKDDTIRIPLTDQISSLDPALIVNDSDIEVAEQLFLGLTNIDPDTLHVVPELALSWEGRQSTSTPPDGSEYIFKLRNDVKWTNGEPVTAHDVVWTIKRNLRAGANSADIADLFLIKNARAIHDAPHNPELLELGVSALDDHTVLFKLNCSVSGFPAIVSRPLFRPLPRDVIEVYGDGWADNTTIQSNGPYKVASWQKGEGIFLDKNPYYFDAKNVAIPEVRYFITSQKQVGLLMFENDEVDVVDSRYLWFSPADVSRIKNGALQSEYHEGLEYCTYNYAVNNSLFPVDNPIVRTALSLAVNKQLLIDTANDGSGKPAAEHIDSHSGFDPVRAKQLLAEAGYANGNNFPTLTMVTGKEQHHQKIARGLASLWQHYLNITVNVVSDTGSDNNQPHLIMARLCNNLPESGNILKRFAGSQNNELSPITCEMELTKDKVKRYELYKRTDGIIRQEGVTVMPIFSEMNHSLVNSKIKSWNHAAMGGQQIHTWSFEKK